LVHLAAASRASGNLHRERRYGLIGRTAVRQHSALEALEMMLELALETPRQAGSLP
jgi:nicotinamide-nucleotide amidase